MQTIKPFALGLQTRCIEYRRRIGMSITATVYFPFAADAAGAAAWTDTSMWTFLGQEMPEGPLIDEGVVKTRAEFLVRGAAYARHGPVRACRVVARVGAREKRLNVFGARHWLGTQISDPEPFERMPF